jgi:hypothetical protein
MKFVVARRKKAPRINKKPDKPFSGSGFVFHGIESPPYLFRQNPACSFPPVDQNRV